MSIRIRTRQANGQQSDELYDTEQRGRAALDRNLNLHRKAGNVVTQNGNVYSVTDPSGGFVQESEIVPSV